jgi:hypothetical protein
VRGSYKTVSFSRDQLRLIDKQAQQPVPVIPVKAGGSRFKASLGNKGRPCQKKKTVIENAHCYK